MKFDHYHESFADDPELSEHRYVLQDRYIDLTRDQLPAIAKTNNWSINQDHCFMRIVLDQLFEDCWYNHLDRRLVAYKQLSDEQLKKAIQLATAILEHGEPLLAAWNRQSLQWRGKCREL